MARKLAEGKQAEKSRVAALAQYYRIKADPALYAKYVEQKREYRKKYQERNRERLRLQSAQRWIENKEKWKPARKRWYEKNKKAHSQKTSANRRKRLYGIDDQRYAEMLAAQGGGCAICGTPPNPAAKPATRTLCVDHDHVTGAVRSLLCHKCNKALGAFPTVELAEKAAQYLKGHV